MTNKEAIGWLKCAINLDEGQFGKKNKDNIIQAFHIVEWLVRFYEATQRVVNESKFVTLKGLASTGDKMTDYTKTCTITAVDELREGIYWTVYTARDDANDMLICSETDIDTDKAYQRLCEKLERKGYEVERD